VLSQGFPGKCLIIQQQYIGYPGAVT